MTTERTTMVMEADDRASAKVEQLGQRLKATFGAQLKSAAISLISFTSILSVMGLSIFSLIDKLKTTFEDIQKTNRAAALLGIQFRLAGFSADRAASAVGSLRENLSRTSLQALPGLDQALQQFLMGLGPASLRELETFAEKLSDISGVPQQEAFQALAEAAAGNMEPLEKMGIFAGDYAEALKEIELGHKDWVDSLTPVESAIRKLKVAWDETWVAIQNSPVAEAGVALATNFLNALQLQLEKGFVAMLLTFNPGELIAKAMILSIAGIDWSRIVKSFQDGLTRFFFGEVESGTGNRSESGLSRLMKMFVALIIGGFSTELTSEESVKGVRLAWEINWALVWEKLKKIVPDWGKDIGIAIRDGLTKFLLGRFFGSLVVDALDSEEGLKGKLEKLWANAKNWGKGIGVAIGNGLIGALEGAINWAVRFVQRWINNVVSRLNSIPGVSISAPSIPGISIPRLDLQPPIPGQRQGSGQTTSVPIIIQVGDREVRRVVMDVLNGEVRVRTPGLAMN